MLNKKQIRIFLQSSLKDCKNTIERASYTKEQTNLIKFGVALAVNYFNSKYANMVKSYDKITVQEIFNLLDVSLDKPIEYTMYCRLINKLRNRNAS